MRCVAIILSGGTGSRMNMDIPKQYIEVCDRMIVTDSIRPFLECELVSDVRIVADDIWQDKIMGEYRILSDYFMGDFNVGMPEHGMDDAGSLGLYKFNGFSHPGENRQLSVLNALYDIKNACEENDLIIIHDAARPLVSVDLIRRCIDAAHGHEGVMPVLPMKDTVYYSEDGKGISRLLERDRIFAGQAPEVFRYGKYIKACEALLPDKIMEIRGSTEPAVKAGMDVVMIPGDERNFKITTREDLSRYKEMIS